MIYVYQTVQCSTHDYTDHVVKVDRPFIMLLGDPPPACNGIAVTILVLVYIW